MTYDYTFALIHVSRCFNVINPTSEAYEFMFEMIISEKPELIPVHCDTLKGYVEGGTSTKVTFSFAPTGPGVSVLYHLIFICMLLTLFLWSY